MFKTTSLAQALAVLGAIDPDAYAASTLTTPWIATSQYQDFLAVIAAGDLGAGATVDAKVEQASDAAGTGAKDVAGSAITQLTQAGGDSNKQAVIGFSTADLDLENGFSHFRLSVTIATASCDLGATVLGGSGRYGPASDYDAATVAEVVIVE